MPDNSEWPYRSWELRKRNGNVLIGRLFACDLDFPAFICKFEPTSAFEEYRALFDEDLALGEPDWERSNEIYTTLNQELILIPGEGGKEVTEFILYIDAKENQGSLRMIFKGE